MFILYTQPLSDIIARHSVLHRMFADDTEMYKSVSRDKIASLLSAMHRCEADVKLWTIQNKLQLNEDKTEALLIRPSVSAGLPLTLRIGHSDIQFFDSARYLGVIFDNKLSMKGQVNNIC